MNPLAAGLLCVAAAAAFGMAPVGVLVCACLLATILPGRGARLLLVSAACLLFVLLNLTKEIEGDLVVYADLQRAIADQPFDILLRADELRHVSGTYRVSELGFYGGLWALTKVFGNTAALIPVAASLAIYLCLAAGLALWARVAGWNDRLTMVVLLVAMFAAINVVQTTHLLRQYLAAAVGFVGLGLLANGRSRWAAIAGIAACSLHNGALVVVTAIAMVHLLFPAGASRRLRWFNWLWRIGLCLAVAGGLMVYLGIREMAHAGRDEGNLSVWHLAFAVGMLAAYLYARHFTRTGTTPTTRLLLIAYGSVLFISAGYFVVGLSLLALRYFAYLEWLYALLAAEMLCLAPRRVPGAYLLSRWAVCAAATGVLILRVGGADWTYADGGASVFLASAPTIASYITR